MPRWLGDNNMLPEWLVVEPGTSRVLLLQVGQRLYCKEHRLPDSDPVSELGKRKLKRWAVGGDVKRIIGVLPLTKTQCSSHKKQKKTIIAAEAEVCNTLSFNLV